jgi:rfaE bifunctional protein kinase chain/domain
VSPGRSRRSTGRFAAVLDGFVRRRVLVLGDMVADEYVVGRPARISREAPVLILEHSAGFVRPGGATNTGYNLHSLGARATLIGVVGDDEPGRRLLSTLAELGMDPSCLLVDGTRPTSTKTRIVAKGTQEAQQQIVRVDRVDAAPLNGPLRARMIDLVRRTLEDVDALIISDYENGVVSSELIDACLPEARRRGIDVVVDSHGDLFRFRGITAATPNQPEAAGTLRTEVRTEADLDAAGRALLEGMDAAGILITRGSEGIALYERGSQPYRLPVALASDSQVVDPTGAGDTVAAVFTLAVSVGAGMRTAAYLGNVAGGEVVRRLGAATLTRQELGAALRRTQLPPPDQEPRPPTLSDRESM